MLRKSLIWHSVFALCLFLFAQNANAQEENLDTIQKYLDEGLEHLSSDFPVTITCLNKAALYAYQEQAWEPYASATMFKISAAGRHFRLDSLYQYLKNADKAYTEIRYDTTEFGSEMKSLIETNWGSYYYKTGNYERALAKFDSIVIRINHKDSLAVFDYEALVSNYLFIGNIFSRKGEHDTAINNFNFAFKYANIIKNMFDKNYDPNKIYNYIAETHYKKGNYEKALSYYKVLNKKYKKRISPNNKSKNRLLNNYNKTAELYLEVNYPDSTLLYLKESLKYHIEDDPFYATTWLNIGKAYTQKAEYKKAKEYIDKALKDNQERYGEKHYKTAQIHLEKGNMYQEKQDLKEALKHYQKSVVSLTDNYDDTSMYSLPANVDVNNKKELLQALQAKANAFYELSLQNKKTENLKHANAHIQLIINLMDDMRREYSSEEARRFLVEQNYPIFEKGIEVNHQLYLETGDKNHLAEAFRMAEKSKSLSLLDALANNDAQQFANIPETTLEQERQLRTQMNHIKEKISKLKKKTENEEALRDLQNELFEQQQQYDDFVATLETEYPDYHDLKYGVSITGVDGVRRDILARDAVFVEYFMGDEQLYTFFITKNDIHIFSTKNTEQIQTNITELRQVITKMDDACYAETAYFLYQNLLKKGLEKIGGNVQQIIVVPDGGLAYIPFDILLEKKIEKSKFSYKKEVIPYLIINKYAVSYAYSATVLQQNLNKPKSNKVEYDFVGFAPNFKRLSGGSLATRSCYGNLLDTLKHTIKEVADISSRFGGKQFMGAAATKDNFLNYGIKSRIIHLSTHACADEDDQLSRIYFGDDEYLTALELYPLRLDADMVVLSACETGIGTDRRGEGVMSLARAFAYTGVPATTTSLWAVNDNTTSLIMRHYYRHLQSGKTKDQALRHAKLDFLEEDEKVSDIQYHPYYWAAFVHIGDAAPLAQDTNWWLWTLMLAVILGIAAVRRLRDK